MIVQVCKNSIGIKKRFFEIRITLDLDNLGYFFSSRKEKVTVNIPLAQRESHNKIQRQHMKTSCTPVATLAEKKLELEVNLPLNERQRK